jgi:hypothetical protein
LRARALRRWDPWPLEWGGSRKIDVRLPGKKDSKFHGARPVQIIITMIK